MVHSFLFRVSGFSLINVDGKEVVWGIIENITSDKENETIFNDNKTLLEYIAVESDLQKILDKIVHFAELRNPNSLCSILLTDEKIEHLLTGSAPSLPDFYNEAIHGVEIGEKVGSCGSAAYKAQRVIVENIDEHENWQPYLELTQQANLHSCWSEPIISSDNKVLGTFAIYSHEPKAPSSFELKLIETYANVASKAIENDQHVQKIKRSEKALKRESESASNNSYKYS